jgi:predicted ATPase
VPTEPFAYISYAAPDNKEGFVIQVQERVAHELLVQTGEQKLVAWDPERMRAGWIWSATAREYTQGASFLIPVISPSYFRSEDCRRELEVFAEKERRTGVSLIFPVYYVEAPEMEAKRGAIPAWADTLRGREILDMRKLRFNLTSITLQHGFALLVAYMRRSLAKLPADGILSETSPGAKPEDPVYVASLRLTNFRCFPHIELNFEHESRLGGRWTCIAGINGAGKSSVLQALGIGLLGFPAAVELGGGRLNRMRRRADLMNWQRAKIELCLRVPERQVPLRLNLEIDDNKIVSPDTAAIADWERLRASTIVGYGATRNLSSRTDSPNEGLSPDVRRLITLFDPLGQLANAGALITQKSLASALIPLFKNLVEQVFVDELRFHLEDGIMFILSERDIVGAIDLPDGFRAAAAWIMDLCAVWCEKAPALAASGNSADIQAIVLIDEIDLHLHPTLQRELIPRLRKALPKVQWIVTTHSPLVLSNFDSSEIIALDRDEPSGVRFLDRQIMGFSANEIYEWLMGTPPNGAAIEEQLRTAGSDPEKQRNAAQLLKTSPFVDGETAKLSVDEMLARLERFEK